MAVINHLIKSLDLLTTRERKRAGLLLGMILIMAILDTIGVASIMPFMAVLANPQIVETNAILATTYKMLKFNDPQTFLFTLGILVFVFLVLSLAFKALTTYAQLRFAYMREYSISKLMVEGYLHQPYTWFLERHSADLGKTILSEVNMVIHQAILPIMTLIAQSTVAIGLLTLLLIVDPLLAFTVGIVLGTAYALIYKLVSGYLARVGTERLQANQARFTSISEAFGASKEVKVSGLERAYIRRFVAPAKIYAQNQASAAVVGQLPRYLLEAIAFGGMLLVMLSLMAHSGDYTSALPVTALYALAGYRLMPALQQIYTSFSQLRFSSAALESLHSDLMSLKPAGQVHSSTDTIISFNQAITLNNIVFTYPKAIQPALKNISLTIPAHSSIGLVGPTGSGKTTMVDLILGLLEPTKGTLRVDEIPINASNYHQWQQIIGYVPQQIYLADDNVAANIAFGVEPGNIDQAAVERAAKIANLHEFVINELRQGYATTVGERGVRLSGGQRQRIGIARALYHNPQLLILDEATSALDNLTEQAVMETMNNLGHEITIILIAHRLSTVRQCDQIYLLEKGQVKANGTYDTLVQENETFRLMTQD